MFSLTVSDSICVYICMFYPLSSILFLSFSLSLDAIDYDQED